MRPDRIVPIAMIVAHVNFLLFVIIPVPFMISIASAPVALPNFSSISAISNQDEVVGAGGASSGGALAWQNGTESVLPAVAGDQACIANGVNAQGQIVGYSYTGNVYHSILWQGGGTTQLPGLGASTREYGINDQGVIVGSAQDSNGLAVAIEIQNGIVTQLGVLPGGYLDSPGLADSRALALNDAGQVVGLSMTQSGVQHAVLWQNGTLTDLGSIAGGGMSAALAINQSGTIVGYAVDGHGIDQAVVWQNGAMTVLQDLDSNGHSLAYSVNDAGIIAGRSDFYTDSQGWQGHAVLWENGALIDLNNFLPANSGWVLNVARSINDNGEVAGMGTYDGVSTAFVLSIGDSSQPMVSAAAALSSFQAAPHGAALSVLDSSATILADLDSLQGMAAMSKLLKVEFTDPTAPTLTLTAQQLSADATVIADLSGNFSLQGTGLSLVEAQAFLGQPHAAAVGVADSGYTIGGDFDQMQSWAASGKLLGIFLTDSGTPTLVLSVESLQNDQQALQDIQGNYQIQVNWATVAQALSIASVPRLHTINIIDTVDDVANSATQLGSLTQSLGYTLTGTTADLQANYTTLEGLQAHAWGLDVRVTDSSFQTLSITVQQQDNDGLLLNGLTGNLILSVSVPQPGYTVTGVGELTTVAVLPGDAANYSIAPWLGQYLQVTGTGSVSGVDNLFDVQAIQFADETVFVVNDPSASIITSGNVAELYSAVLARAPDLAGLAYYNRVIDTDFSLTKVQLAEYFLNSSEYLNNPAHAYAQSAAGDAQFITDTYQNLLHRAPDAGAVPFYQAVIAQATAGLTPGTAAYANAQMQGHAQVLVYFSASAEFLNDVQVTTQHPANAQHWLYLI